MSKIVGEFSKFFQIKFFRVPVRPHLLFEEEHRAGSQGEKEERQEAQGTKGKFLNYYL